MKRIIIPQETISEMIEFRKNGFSFKEISNLTGVSERRARTLTEHIKLSKEQISRKISEIRKNQENKTFESMIIDKTVLADAIEKYGVYNARKVMGVSYEGVKFWAKKYGIKTRKSIKSVRYDFCNMCKKTYPENQKKKGKFCNTCVSKIRRLLCKNRAILLKGKKCEECGYILTNYNSASFEFHHKFGEKDFVIGSAMNRKWEYVKKELDKCILLCSNCHRIHHSDYNNEVLRRICAEKIEEYKNIGMDEWETAYQKNSNNKITGLSDGLN